MQKRLVDSQDREIARLTAERFDFEWHYGRLEPLDGFEHYQELFQMAENLEQARLSAIEFNENNPRLELLDNAVQARIRKLGLRIKTSSGYVDYTALRIRGNNYEYH